MRDVFAERQRTTFAQFAGLHALLKYLPRSGSDSARDNHTRTVV
jgi:hypothetical protein